MDFLGNQRRMNFPGKRIGDGFSWESNEGCKKIKNNNLIRLVPARIEIQIQIQGDSSLGKMDILTFYLLKLKINKRHLQVIIWQN